MFIPSIERFARMAEENGHIVLDDDGIWQKRTDGSPLQFTDSIGRKYSPPLLRPDFDAWRKARLVSQDLSAPAERGLVFALTRRGLKAATNFAGRRGLRKGVVG
jgi:hypothetical protein